MNSDKSLSCFKFPFKLMGLLSICSWDLQAKKLAVKIPVTTSE
jgi:hypothetical protein